MARATLAGASGARSWPPSSLACLSCSLPLSLSGAGGPRRGSSDGPGEGGPSTEGHGVWVLCNRLAQSSACFGELVCNVSASATGLTELEIQWTKQLDQAGKVCADQGWSIFHHAAKRSYDF
ncbi:unnamed protein product [Miscanthus lutarioriparius]|uniref:Uncharacterized protein n=1 Tax=Miscanthus lutarioriparius TaxID=422564 RepID=A0A811S6E2_9POAL|nr:unnamed protein product [Miscanthus lutarioriparius]